MVACAGSQVVLKRGLKIFIKQVGELHPETAQVYHTMGMVLEMLERFQEALKVQRKAVDIRRKTLGPHHQKVARSLNNLAITLKRSNHLDLAYATLEEALAIKVRIWGPHHTSVGTTYQTMAGILKVQGKNEEVRSLLPLLSVPHTHAHTRGLIVCHTHLGGDRRRVRTAVVMRRNCFALDRNNLCVYTGSSSLLNNCHAQ